MGEKIPNSAFIALQNPIRCEQLNSYYADDRYCQRNPRWKRHLVIILRQVEECFERFG